MGKKMGGTEWEGKTEEKVRKQKRKGKWRRKNSRENKWRMKWEKRKGSAGPNEVRDGEEGEGI